MISVTVLTPLYPAVCIFSANSEDSLWFLLLAGLCNKMLFVFVRGLVLKTELFCFLTEEAWSHAVSEQGS